MADVTLALDPAARLRRPAGAPVRTAGRQTHPGGAGNPRRAGCGRRGRAPARRALALAFGLLLAACAGAPPPPEPATAPGRFAAGPADLARREAQVRRAAQGLGWAVGEAAPGRLLLRRPDAGGAGEVAVEFTAEAFALRPAPGAAEPPGLAELRASIVAQSAV